MLGGLLGAFWRLVSFLIKGGIGRYTLDTTLSFGASGGGGAWRPFGGDCVLDDIFLSVGYFLN
jgi:hypothetical protein